jgi:hypothetical protein
LFVGALLILILISQQPLPVYSLECLFWALVIGLVVDNLLRLPEIITKPVLSF